MRAERNQPLPTKQEVTAKMSLFMKQHSNMRIACIKSSAELEEVKLLRLKIYNENLPYMLKQIGESGSDEYDKRSFIFAAWYNQKIVASIRLTPYPFETHNYVNDHHLAQFLGAEWQSKYLEWSRLLVDSSSKIKGLVSTLTMYAGLYILSETNYTSYFGYTRPHVKRLLSKFQLDIHSTSFTIPDRGEHEYLLIKGSFLNDFSNIEVLQTTDYSLSNIIK